MSTTPWTRRRFLSICAMAGAMGAMPWLEAAASVPLHHWNGILLGTNVGFSFAHPDRREAEKLFSLCVRDIQRLESIFTLYDSHSDLSRLNRDGVLDQPPQDLINILEQAKDYHRITGGAFDITVQPLWDLYKDLSYPPSPQDLKPVLSRIGMDHVSWTKNQIRFDRPGMAITLNGIAQGYITDRITDILKDQGLTSVLVELGEKRSIGPRPDGRPWQLALQSHGTVYDVIDLQDKALATSSGSGLTFGNGAHHIFNPCTGRNPSPEKTLSVVAETATAADALSTGLLCLPQTQAEQIADATSFVSALCYDNG